MVQASSLKTPPQLTSLLSTRGKDLPAPRLGDPQKAANMISFVFGYPDRESLPAMEVAEATTRAMEKGGDWALQYGKSTGAPVLIDFLVEKLKRDQGIDVRPENVLITSGGSQAVQLVIDLLVDPGDTVIVEAPTWMGFLYALHNVKAHAIGIPVEEDGMDLDALDQELKRLRAEGKTAKSIYVISNFQNPSGVTTSLEKRKRLVELAQEYGTLILEDDAYYDLRYSGERIPPIYTLDDSGSTMYLGTFSKIMGAGMRLGWLVAAPEIITKLSVLKTDGATSVFGSYVAAEWAPTYLNDHIERLKTIYQRRRDILIESLEKYMPEGTTWTVPDGGFFVWVTLPDGIDTAQMLPMARERGVEYLAGTTCFPDGRGVNQMRLSYSFVPDDKIEEGIRILGEIVEGELKER
jgi:2-aminoadipate transaminase